MDKKKKAALSKQEDIALTRAMLWFAAAMVLEFLLLLVNKYYIGFTTDSASIALAQVLHVVIRVVAVLGLAFGVAAAIWCRRASVKSGELAFGPMLLSVSAFALGISGVLIVALYAAAVDLLCVVVPALAVLVLVYYLYQKEFFLSALCSGVGLLGLWLVRRGSARMDLVITLYAVVGIVLLAVALVLTLCLKKNGGVLTVKGKARALFGKQTNYLPVILSCVFGLLALAACLVLGNTAAFYLLFGLLAWLLLLLVYYTVKLM
ncbi:MAG: hypothetical protein IJA11_02985 [Oscillospiraceae bacterium]|nr:hypothetical protein [Oscillospiraceae bacterium]